MADTTTDIKPGDWIRFYDDGLLVIEVVQYVRGKGTTVDPCVAVTDVREVPFDSIYEVRKAKESK